MKSQVEVEKWYGSAMEQYRKLSLDYSKSFTTIEALLPKTKSVSGGDHAKILSRMDDTGIIIEGKQ